MSTSVVSGTGLVSLLEREPELEQLESLLARTGEGRGGVVVIEGAGGIGKTELLRTVAARAAERGCLVMRAAGNQLELSIPFGVARQLFEPPLCDAGEAARRRLLDGAAAFGGRAIGIGDADSLPDGSAALHGLYLAVHKPGRRRAGVDRGR